jgi:hypothetical protein
MIQDRGMSDRGKMMDGMKYSGPFLLAKCHFDRNYAIVIFKFYKRFQNPLVPSFLSSKIPLFNLF